MTSAGDQNADSAANEPSLLAEYNSLREEMLGYKNRRHMFMSFVVGAFGVILSFGTNLVVRSDLLIPSDKLGIAIGTGMILYGILIPTVIMSLKNEQALERIGKYIRTYIELHVSGLNWEHRYRNHCQQHYQAGVHGMGTIYLFLTILPLLLPMVGLAHNTRGWPFLFLLVPLFCWSAILSYDMYAAVSKEWKLEWAPESDDLD